MTGEGIRGISPPSKAFPNPHTDSEREGVIWFRKHGSQHELASNEPQWRPVKRGQRIRSYSRLIWLNHGPFWDTNTVKQCWCCTKANEKFGSVAKLVVGNRHYL
jgi:hypothetical protein